MMCDRASMQYNICRLVGEGLRKGERLCNIFNRTKRRYCRRSLVTDSVAKLKEELKGMLEGLDVVILDRALEWARQQYRAVVERLDQLLLETCSSGLTAEHIRSVWYNTVLGRGGGRRGEDPGGEGGG